jgi:hypothetical protein
VPPDLDPIGPAPKKQPHDVFLYVISGFKAHDPQAAIALAALL